MKTHLNGSLDKKCAVAVSPTTKSEMRDNKILNRPLLVLFPPHTLISLTAYMSEQFQKRAEEEDRETDARPSPLARTGRLERDAGSPQPLLLLKIPRPLFPPRLTYWQAIVTCLNRHGSQAGVWANSVAR